MEYALSEAGGVTVVTVDGEIDASTLPPLHAEILHLLQRPGLCLIIDLAAVTFLDSSGLSLLIEATNRLRDNGGRLAVTSAVPHRLRVIWLTGLDQFLPLHDSLDAALHHMRTTA
ncbi:STAS domain-containing protein [Nonomuraea sp. NPDC050394]|uniref:STAS domain-containing protein n=1 Tax=Nonomuraea sp. NPDC050394 TaxID=3364363 RepID=UPI00379D8DEB